jgi:hypothetical protein
MEEANNGGQGEIVIEYLAVMFYLFSLALDKQDDSSLPGGNVQRLIGSVEH